MHTFTNKSVLLAGATTGMGKELARLLATEGANVTVIGRTAAKGEAVVKELQDKNLHVDFVQLDMTDTTKVGATYEALAKKYGTLDYVFNIAGSFMAGEVRDTTIEDWHKIMDEDVYSVYNGAHYAYQIMLRQGSGHLINMGSSAGLFPVPGMVIYGSSKYAIVGLSHGMRIEAKDLGVKVSVITPIIVNTPLYDTASYERADKQRALKSRGFVQQARPAAKRIIKGVKKNRATIHTSWLGYGNWLAYRLFPGIYNRLALSAIRSYRKHLRTD